LEQYADLRFSPAELHSYLAAAWDLWSQDPNRKRFVENLNGFFDEMEEQRQSRFKIGRYISRRLKN
jgi:hypothetical protein